MAYHPLAHLATYARRHGFHARLDGDAVLVWDDDGSIRTGCITALRRWLGY